MKNTFENTAYNLAKYSKCLAINTLINDKARYDFYKPINSMSIYQKTVKRIHLLTY